VIQSYYRRRAWRAIKSAYAALGLEQVRGVVIIWNNEKVHWPVRWFKKRFKEIDAPPMLRRGATTIPTHDDGTARSLPLPAAEIWREEATDLVDLHVGGREAQVRKLKPLVIFAAEDRIDNHFLVPPLFATEADFRAVLVMDDDVPVLEEFVECAVAVNTRQPHLMVTVKSSLRAFLNPISPATMDRPLNPMGPPLNDHGDLYCAGLPQTILIPLPYLRAYREHLHVATFINGSQICDDFAMFAVARWHHRHHHLGTSASTRLQGSSPTTAPMLPGVAQDVLAALEVDLPHLGTGGSLSGEPGHYKKRGECFVGIAAAFRRDHPDTGPHDPVFTPASTFCHCDGVCGPPPPVKHPSILPGRGDGNGSSLPWPKVCQDVLHSDAGG